MWRGAALVVALCVASAHALAGSPGTVHELTSRNFDAEVRRGPYFVEVYAPWCGHCQQLAPVWEQMAKQLQGEVLVGKVNGPEQRALAQRLGVNAYPTLLLFRDGEMRAYGGPRGLSHLTHFARSGWRNVRAAPLHRTPNNAIGWVTGLFYRLPTLLDGAYRTAAEDWGLSMPGILAVGVGGFAIAAAAIIAGLDALARDTPTRRAHVD